MCVLIGFQSMLATTLKQTEEMPMNVWEQTSTVQACKKMFTQFFFASMLVTLLLYINRFDCKLFQ